jgi:hypothetical protein
MNQPIVTPIEFYQRIMQAINEGTHEVALAIPLALKPILISYWPYIIIFILLFFLSRFLDRGIGSVIYNIFYFGILSMIIALKGFDILFSPYFDLACVLVYLLSFYITGLILREIKPRARRSNKF